MNLIKINGLNSSRRANASRPQTKTVFVDNFFCSRANRHLSVEVVPHLGLMTLASVLEHVGQRVEIFDPKLLFAAGGWSEPGGEFLDAWAEELLARQADVIGFTAYGRSLPYVIRVAERIKRASPRQSVVLGGPHATIVGESIMERFGCFDAVVRYEAEPVIADLVGALARGEDLSSLPNLVYREGGRVVATPKQAFLPEMDELPGLALHLYPIERLRPAELSIEAGRGCPFDCTFCSTSRFFQRRYRLKSNERMLAEMEAARARYQINLFNLNHDLFGLVKKSVFEFCELARGRDFNWKCSMRPDTVDARLAAALEAAGCRHIYFGLETGSQRLQKVIRKNLKLARSAETLRDVVGLGMHCTASFITGFPEEGEAEQDETLDLIGDLLRLDPQRVHPQLHVLSPEPGSLLADGRQALFYDGVGPEVDEFLDDELIRTHPDVFSVFYHYESPVPRWRTVLASAFIMHLVPELGHPLTTHLTANFFGGRLSALFRDVAHGARAEVLPYEAVVRELHEGLDAAVAGLASEAPYLRDLVRLSRVLSAIKRAVGLRLPGDVRRLDGSTWLARFDYDVLTLAQDVLESPAAPIPASRCVAGEQWLLLRHEGDERLATGALATEAGRWLHRMASHESTMPEEYARLFEELEVQLIEAD